MHNEENEEEKIPFVKDDTPFYKTKKGMIGIVIAACCLGLILLLAIGSMVSQDKTTNPSTTSNNPNEDKNFLTTDILTAKDCKLDKYSFDSPENHEKEFYVKLAKHNNNEIGFEIVNSGAYENYKKFVETGVHQGKKTTIAGFEGYLDTEAGFIFVFIDEGQYYMISDVELNMNWNNHVEKDITILLEEWKSKR